MLDKTTPETLLRSLEPSLEQLSYALRHPETWPKGFWWDYSRCNHCAMGLAYELWPEKVAHHNESAMAHAFAMPYEEADRIFIHANGMRCNRILGILPRSRDSISPEMVADAIDNYLVKKR